jgi:hypothetical protein
MAGQHRVSKLIEGHHNGTLSAEETSELDDFTQVEHLPTMAKAQARRRLQLANAD